MTSQACVSVSASQKEAISLSALIIVGVYVGGHNRGHGEAKRSTPSIVQFGQVERNL